MEHQVRERNAAEGDQEIIHMCEIRLPSFSWSMPLLKDHFLLWTMQRFPLRDVSLQRAHLDGLIALGMPLTQQRKERRPLQSRISLQLRDHPRPVFFKRVRARSPRMGTFPFTG